MKALVTPYEILPRLGALEADIGAGRREVDVDPARAGSRVDDPHRKETVARIIERVVAENRAYAGKGAEDDVGVVVAGDVIRRVDQRRRRAGDPYRKHRRPAVDAGVLGQSLKRQSRHNRLRRDGDIERGRFRESIENA